MGYPGPLNWQSDNVLPVVYEESLSYYEVMCKILNYFNSINERFKDIKYEDEPLKVEVVPESYLKVEEDTAAN